MHRSAPSRWRLATCTRLRKSDICIAARRDRPGRLAICSENQSKIRSGRRSFNQPAARPCARLSLINTGLINAAIRSYTRTAAVLLLAATVSLSQLLLPASSVALTTASYDGMARSHHKRSAVNSALPNFSEAETIAELNRDLFTEEAYQGMLEIIKYARYVEEHQPLQDAPGCEDCESNRITLEKAWQVVANEFFDASKTFRQDKWAQILLETLKDSGGVLRTKHQLHDAAHRMIASLGDPYSEWLPPSEFRRALRKPLPAERKYLSVQMSGVGIAVGSHNRAGGWTVEAPLAGSPAEQGGIIRGERILKIDDYDVEGLALTRDEVTALLRGPAGSTVAMMIGGQAASVTSSSQPLSAAAIPDREVVVERRALPQPPLRESRLAMSEGREAALIRIHYFASETRRAFQSALLRGEIDGVDGYILDLRNDPGGVFEDAIAIASMVLNEGLSVATTIRTTEGFIDNSFKVGGLSKEVFLNLPGTVTRAPMVVLVNSATASASEVLAGALHDNDRAVLIGEKTFGKGVVQYYFPVHGDGGLRLTVAKYMTPKHDITETGGLVPDLECSDYPHAGAPSVTNDRCLAAAVQSLNQEQGLIELPTLYARAGQSVG